MKFCPQCDTGYPNDAATCPIHAELLSEMRDLRPGLLVANSYRIFRKLGQGAAGSVYLAANEQTDEPRALRFLTAELSRNVAFMSRYQRTARTLAQIEQRSIISTGVLETAEDGSLFFAMDYVDGPTLRELMNMAPGPFDVGLAFALARCIAEGLGAAHAAKVFHLDLRPENILIARDGPTLAPKIANFGIGVIKTNGTGPGHSSGRSVLISSYAAPEQWLESKPAELDGRTDLYALGAILFEMLTGEALFQAKDFEDWAMHHVSPVPRRPSELRPELAKQNGLDRLVLSLLAKKPQDRPRDSAEVLRQLDGIQFGSPVIETPPAVIASPRAVTVSRHAVIEDPADVLEPSLAVTKLPRVSIETPAAVQVRSAAVVVAPPSVVETSPVAIDSSPAVVELPPAVIAVAPVVTEPPPAVTEPPPVTIATPPAIIESSPVVVEPPPAVIAAAPVVTELLPAVTEPPPVAIATPPAVIASSPAIVEPPPAVIAAAPVVAELPPAVAWPPSVAAAAPPAVTAPPPVVEPPPAVIAAPPVVAIPAPTAAETPSAFIATPPAVTRPPVVATRPAVIEPPPIVVEAFEQDELPPEILEDDDAVFAEQQSPASQEDIYLSDEEFAAEILKQESYFGSRMREADDEENNSRQTELPTSFSLDPVSAQDRVWRAQAFEPQGLYEGRDQEEDAGEEPEAAPELPNFLTRILSRSKNEAMPSVVPDRQSYFPSKDTSQDSKDESGGVSAAPQFSSRVPTRDYVPVQPTRIPEPPVFSGRKDTPQDFKVAPRDDAAFSQFSSRVPARDNAPVQTKEPPESTIFSDRKSTPPDIRQRPVNTAVPHSAPPELFTGFPGRGGGVRALPNEAAKQPAVASGLERGSDSLFKPRGSEDFSGFSPRDYAGGGTAAGSSGISASPRFIGRADTTRNADTPPQSLADLPDWLRRVSPDMGPGNGPKKATESQSQLGGVNKATEWGPDSVPESPTAYVPPSVRNEVHPKDWVATGVTRNLRPENTPKIAAEMQVAEPASPLGEVNPANASPEILPPEVEPSHAFVPVDEPGETESEPTQTEEFTGLLSDSPSAPYAYYVQGDEDDDPPPNKYGVVLKVGAALFTVAALGFAIWTAGFSKTTPPVANTSKACDGGDAKACAGLAQWYEQTNTVSDGDEKAVTYYSKACDGSFGPACRKLGLKYLLGNGATRDNPKSIALLGRACDLADFEGCDTLAGIYHDGKGVPVNDKKAGVLYSKACAAGDDFGCKWAKKLETPVKPLARLYSPRPTTASSDGAR
ncbi:MAG: serine/threonine-protein kinase [Terracidiphilus sp.]